MQNNTKRIPPIKILRVETGYIDKNLELDQNYLDYHVFQGFPGLLRWIEKKLRLDVFLAWKAKRISNDNAIIWARSEKVGIPLSLMNINRPIVLSAHFLESPLKAAFIRATGMAKKWAAVGYYSEGQKNFLKNKFGIHEDTLFFSDMPHFLHIDPAQSSYDGPIVSLGVSKRDYPTLLKALSMLEGYSSELYIASKYGDTLAKKIEMPQIEWVKFFDFLPQSEIEKVYQKTRFVIVPLQDTKQTGAGLNSIFEAMAFGKAVIATRNKGTEYFIRDGETGILVPPYDTDAMRNAIHKLWNDPELAKRMGTAGRKYLKAEFNPDLINSRINSQFSRIYQEFYSH